MPVGIVRYYNTERGFGFVTPDDGGPDIFVHVSEIERSGLAAIKEGDLLEFDVVLDPRTKKFFARSLDLIEPKTPST